LRRCLCVTQEKLDRAANYARVMEELSQLGAFVRLADYLFVEGVMVAAVTSVEELLGALTAHKQQVRGRAGRQCPRLLAVSSDDGPPRAPAPPSAAGTTPPHTQMDKSKALFQVAVSFDPEGVAFWPNEAAILGEINTNTLEGIVSVAQVCGAVCADVLPRPARQQHMYACMHGRVARHATLLPRPCPARRPRRACCSCAPLATCLTPSPAA
jgi:hypothetical protein